MNDENDIEVIQAISESRETVKGPVPGWTTEDLALQGRAYKKLADDPQRFHERMDRLKSEGDAILASDDIPVPPYILIAIRDKDERTLKAFFNRRGADERLTIKVKEVMKNVR